MKTSWGIGILLCLEFSGAFAQSESDCYLRGKAYAQGTIINDKVCINGAWVPRSDPGTSQPNQDGGRKK